MALFLSALVVLSVVGPGIAGAAAGEGKEAITSGDFTSNGEFVSSDEFVNSSANVSIWERAALPLRVDTSTAATTVNVSRTIVNATEFDGETTLNKNTLGVYNTSSTIPVKFAERDGANTSQFGGEDVQLVIARLNESEDRPDTSDVNSTLTIGEAIERLVGENLSSEEVNSNFTFLDPKNDQIDSQGSVAFDVVPDAPGHYAFILVASENGNAVSVQDGNVTSVDDGARVLGVDGAPVQAAEAEASPSPDRVQRGENVTFTLDSNLDADSVNHTVVVFNESVLSGQSTRITIDGEIDGNLSTENVTIDHSIEAVDGVARLDSGANVLGTDLTDGQVDGTVTLASIIDRLANETNQTAPETTATDDVVLNASMTAVSDAPSSETLNVTTGENWTNGSYTYLYIASTNNSSEFSTTRGSIDVGPEESEERKKVQLEISANRTNVTVGDKVEITVIRQGGGAAADVRVLVDGEPVATTNSQGQAVISLDQQGTQTVRVTKPQNSTTEFLDASVPITAEVAPDPPAPPAGGGGQPGGDDDPGSANPVPTNEGATVNFRDLQGGQPISVEVPSVASENAAVTGMEITTRFSEDDFRVEFTEPREDTPQGAPELDQPTKEAIQYFTAEAIGLSDDRIEEVEFTFTLDESELPEGTDKDDVRLFRYTNGEWTTLETTHLGGNEYRATSPGFTAYAIGVQSEQTETETDTVTETDTETETETDTETDTETATETPDQPFLGGGSLGALLVVLLLVVALVGGFYLYREGYLDELRDR